MLEYIALGALQGVAEWLPISSEAVVILATTHLFPTLLLSDAIRLALFLHLGTFLAALVYLRHDVRKLLRAVYHYTTANEIEKRELTFLIQASLVTAVIALPLLKLIDESSALLAVSAGVLGAIIGAFLIVTGLLHMQSDKKEGERESNTLTTKDGVITGVFQGFAAIPGLSRSGLTVAALLLRGINDQTALRLSFLLSLPVVLGGNILLNSTRVTAMGAPEAAALITSFVFGLATISLLMKVARHISWSSFTIIAGILLIIAAFV